MRSPLSEVLVVRSPRTGRLMEIRAPDVSLGRASMAAVVSSHACREKVPSSRYTTGRAASYPGNKALQEMCQCAGKEGDQARVGREVDTPRWRYSWCLARPSGQPAARSFDQRD